MTSFLKKLFPRDLEKIIFDIAERREDDDFVALYRRMRGRIAFVPVDPSTLPAGVVLGRTYTTKSNDCVHVPTGPGPNDMRLVPAATKEDCSLLKRGYVGMIWEEFLSMVVRGNEASHGVVLQGETSWVIFDRERISYILSNRWA